MNPVYKHLQAKNKFLGLEITDFFGIVVIFGFCLMFTNKILTSLSVSLFLFVGLFLIKRNKPSSWTKHALEHQIKDKTFMAGTPGIGVGFSSKLPYFGFDEDCLINIDGSVALGYELSGIDAHCMDEEDLDNVSQRLNDMFDSLDQETSLQFVFDSKNLWDVKDNIFDRYLEQIDKKKTFPLLLAQSKVLHLRALKLFQSKCHLYMVKKPKSERNLKKVNPFDQVPVRLEKLRQNQKTLHTHLSSLGLNPQLLGQDKFKEKIYDKLNPERMIRFPYQSTQKKFSHNEATLRSQLWLSGMSVFRDHVYFDNTYARAITFHSLPEFTHSGLLLPILEGIKANHPLDYQLTVNVDVVDQQKEILEQKMKRNITHVLQNFGSKRDYAAEAGNQDAEAVLQTMIQEGKRIYHVSVIVMVYSKFLKELNEHSDYVLHAFRSIAGSEGMVEEYGQEQAFVSSLPASSIGFHRKFKFMSHNMGDLCPVFERWKGCETPSTLFMNDRNGLVSYNLFDRKNLENYNALVVGASGMGKSFAVSFLTSSYASQGYPVWFVDIGGSYKRMVECYGGDYFEIGPGYALNPLCKVEDYNDKRHLALLGVMEAMLVEDKDLIYEQKNFVDLSVRSLYADFKGEPILADLQKKMYELATHDGHKNLASRFDYWINGPYRSLFNQKSSISVSHNVVAFDLKGIEKDARKIVLLIIASLLGALIEKNQDPKIVVFDECWDLIRSGANVIESLYRTGRKHNLSVMSVTQSFMDFVSCPIAGAILSNSAVRYALPVREGYDLLSEHLKLNERELELIKTLRQEKGKFSEIFVQFGSHHTILRLSPSPLEYWTCTTHAPDVELEKELALRRGGAPRLEVLLELASKYPYGSAGIPKGGKHAT